MRGARAPSPASRAASSRTASARRSARYERRRAPGEVGEQLAQLGPEDRVLAERVVGRLELLERGHQRLRHVATAEIALHPPPTGPVGIEQAGMDGGRAEGDVRAVVAGGAGSLDEQRDAERILGRAFAGDARPLDAGRDIDPDGRDRTQRACDVGRVEAAGQGDRHFPGDRGGQPLGGARPRPARMRSARGVEEEPLDAGRRGRPAARHEVGRRPRTGSVGSAAGRWRTFQVRRAIARAAATDSVPLSWTTSGSSAATMRSRLSRRRVGGDRDDERPSTRRRRHSGPAVRAPRPRRARARGACPRRRSARSRPPRPRPRRGRRRRR